MQRLPYQQTASKTVMQNPLLLWCGAHGERIWEPSLSFSLKLRSYWPSLVMNSEAATSMPIFTLPV